MKRMYRQHIAPCEVQPFDFLVIPLLNENVGMVYKVDMDYIYFITNIEVKTHSFPARINRRSLNIEIIFIGSSSGEFVCEGKSR